MIFVIDDRIWLRGEGVTSSRLLRSKDGKMCCIGFCALRLGKTKEEIKDRAGIEDVDPLAAKRLVPNGDMFEQLDNVYWANDDMRISDEVRKATLRKWFKSQGHQVRFTHQKPVLLVDGPNTAKRTHA